MLVVFPHLERRSVVDPAVERVVALDVTMYAASWFVGDLVLGEPLLGSWISDRRFSETARHTAGQLPVNTEVW